MNVRICSVASSRSIVNGCILYMGDISELRVYSYSTLCHSHTVYYHIGKIIESSP